MTKQYFSNVHLALEDEIITDSSLTVMKMVSSKPLGAMPPASSKEIDGKGGLLVPGAVDVALRRLGKLIETRPNARDAAAIHHAAG